MKPTIASLKSQNNSLMTNTNARSMPPHTGTGTLQLTTRVNCLDLPHLSFTGAKITCMNNLKAAKELYNSHSKDSMKNVQMESNVVLP